MKKVVLKKIGVEKLKSFNPWIYYNEIKKIPKNIEKGEVVEIFSPEGKFLGTGYINTESKITVRILSFFKRVSFDKNLLAERIKEAFKKRKPLLSKTNSFRVVHSEADSLPGLIIDYYDGYVSIQINTAGMETVRREILEAILEVLPVKGIYEKSDKNSRKKEGLETSEKVLYGNISEEITVKENNTSFIVNLKEGQKTGFFLDQRKNREIVTSFIKEGFSVLDLFSNTGGFGIYAAKNGAEYVKFVDISENAVKQIEKNCEINGLSSYNIVKADVFDFLKEEKKKGAIYDLIIIDPPSFAKTKKEKEGALRGFKYLILNSIKLLSENGLIAVFSCSHHVGMEDLKKVTLSASVDVKTPVEILEHLYQDIDHPYILNIPNSLYLKGFIFRKSSI